MTLQIDWKLFLSTLALIFVAELPDKTAFATLLLATRKHPLAIFIGVAMAFVIQSVVAVSFGSALGLLPRQWVSIGAAVLFILSAFLMWRRKDHEEENLHLENQKSNFLRTIWSSFVVIFIAEWGDLTQLASATLAAEHKKPVTVFLAATLALWTVTALAILVGNQAKKGHSAGPSSKDCSRSITAEPGAEEYPTNHRPPSKRRRLRKLFDS